MFSLPHEIRADIKAAGKYDHAPRRELRRVRLAALSDGVVR